jgi:glucose/arabinose dehydrogenase
MARRLMTTLGAAALATGAVAALHAQAPATTGLVRVEVEGHPLQVPRGFAVGVYASGLPGARFMVLGPDGVPYLSLTARGRVVKLPDLNGDGRADTIITVAEGLDLPHGLAFRGDTLYVAETNRVVRFVPGSTTPQVVVPDLPHGRGHSTRTIVFGPRDGMLYVSVGSSCNICDESDPRRAAVLRYRPDGSGGEIFARGLRNSVGLAFHPTTGALWGTNNDRDRLGDDLPPDRVNIIREGGTYGWPQCYLPGHPNPEYSDADCGRVDPPAITFQAHSAPLGIAFSTGTQFPPAYRGGAFVAFHGSWNRSIPTGYKLVYVTVRDGRPAGVADFLIGFLPAEGPPPWARPVGVLVAPDGSLLLSDDSAGHVFRVHYVGR